MRQTFTFADSKHKPPQALASLKNRVRKYVKRERRKSLPEGVDYWDFDCKVGNTEQTAEDTHISEVTNRMGAIFDSGNPTVYVEILAKPGIRKGSAKAAPTAKKRASNLSQSADKGPSTPAGVPKPSSDWSFG